MQKELPLRLLHLARHLLVDVLLDLEQLYLLAEDPVQLREARAEIDRLEEPLLVVVVHGEMRGDRVREDAPVLDRLDREEHLVRHPGIHPHVVAEEGLHAARERLDLARRRLLRREIRDAGAEVVVLLDVVEHAHPAHALEHDLDGAVRKVQVVEDLHERPDAVQVFRAGLVDGGVPLGDDDEILVRLDRPLDGVHRRLPTDEDRRCHRRKYDDVSQRHERIDVQLPLAIALRSELHSDATAVVPETASARGITAP